MNLLSNKNETLMVSEQFGPTLQGEGRTAGVPAYFLRLTGCNLSCGRKNVSKDYDNTRLIEATWVCDTIEVFRQGNKKTNDQIVKDFGTKFLYNICANNYHLIITGGEPLLQQGSLLQFIKHTAKAGSQLPFVEIETNGTVIPSKELLEVVGQWNVSPKLSNSGMREYKRTNIEALSILNATKSQFKFVISNISDLKEMRQTFEKHVTPNKIYLMPSCGTRDELITSSKLIAKLCLEYGYKYSTRLQLMIWNKKTGV